MKKQLSLLLLTLSIFSINTLPGQASIRITGSNSQSNILKKSGSYATINGNKWCAEVPWMGLFCYLF